MSGWTDPEIDILKRMWAGEGASASAIAAKLPGRTRNSVIAKADRMGLSQKSRNAASAPSGSRPRGAVRLGLASKPQGVRAGQPTCPPEVLAARRANAEAQADHHVRRTVGEVTPTAVPLIGHSRSVCAWPVGEPDRPADQMCCGRRVHGELRYCLEHAQRATPRDITQPRPADEFDRLARGIGQ